MRASLLVLAKSTCYLGSATEEIRIGLLKMKELITL